MATRLYFSELQLLSAGGSAFYTADSSWEVLDNTTRSCLLLSEKNAGESQASTAFNTALNTPAGAVDVLVRQGITPPLASDVTISGDIKGYILVFEDNSATDARMQCVIRVIAPNGTVRGTLIASDTGALSSEFDVITEESRAFPRGAPVTPSSVAAQAGDHIVVEIGWRKHENATTDRFCNFLLGAPSSGSDLPENETATTGVAWVEFADTLSFSQIPWFLDAAAGATDAGGAWNYACQAPNAVGRVFIVQILQDGTTTGAVVRTGGININTLAGGTGWTALAPEQAVGSPTSGLQSLYIGRSTVSGSAPTISGTNSTSEDLYIRSYQFTNVSTGTTLATVVENGTAGTVVNGAGTSTTVADTGVTTLGSDRLALNFVALSDDAMGLAVFDGETGGNWTLPVAIYESSSGTDGTIALMTADMMSAGTIDGGSDTITSIGWGVLGTALIGRAVAAAYVPRHPAHDHGSVTIF